jgi:hypothetical protein
MRRILLAAALMALGCEDFLGRNPTSSQSPAPTTAKIEVTVVPDPIPMTVTCASPPGEFCSGAIDPTVTIAETAGLGGHLNFVEIVVRNVTASKDESRVMLDSSAISRQVGTNRIEAMGRLAFRPVVTGYPVPASGPRPQLSIVLTVQFADDKGNVLTETARVNVVSS